MPRPKVEPATELTPAQKLQMSLQMFDYGCDMMRQKLRREHPEADAAAIEELLVQWLRQRPGAEHGDGVGRPGRWPRNTWWAELLRRAVDDLAALGAGYALVGGHAIRALHLVARVARLRRGLQA